ncbi:hypothetical protein VST7929_01541 [Vibrio stylophorae]|uniref:Methyl-accepting chemotaxis protein n=1 Tax=Vibrio stylophorae TaxID=659351 RepID=A0ABM8ZU25_9VIBR|nr:hypothetical protein [Vibrio stylophorae]CAH0533670.1 hypothetical protein VST7929_01541 [Vibrio stylophorae]
MQGLSQVQVSQWRLSRALILWMCLMVLCLMLMAGLYQSQKMARLSDEHAFFEQYWPLSQHHQTLKQLNFELGQWANDVVQRNARGELEQAIARFERLERGLTQQHAAFEAAKKQLPSSAQQALLLNIRNDQPWQQLQQSGRVLYHYQGELIPLAQEIADKKRQFSYAITMVRAEMSRVGLILFADNPEATEYVTTFVNNSAAMESAYLAYLVEQNGARARKDLRQLKHSFARMEVSLQELMRIEPSLVNYHNILVPFDMVALGFSTQGLLQQHMALVDLQQRQSMALADFQSQVMLMTQALNQRQQQIQAELLRLKQRLAVKPPTTLYALWLSACLILIGYGVQLIWRLHQQRHQVSQALQAPMHAANFKLIEEYASIYNGLVERLSPILASRQRAVVAVAKSQQQNEGHDSVSPFVMKPCPMTGVSSLNELSGSREKV